MATNPRQVRLKSCLASWFEALRQLRNVTPNTIMSYKDAWRLLYRFGIEERRLPSSGDWRLTQVDREFVLAFLSYLEEQRKCGVSTRNLRLAALHSFFRYLRGLEPLCREHCDRVLSIPRKRTSHPVMGYLESEEVQAVFDTVDMSRTLGLRDLALLTFAYNSGARVHEMAKLRQEWLSLKANPSVRLWGKGRKQRELPLFPATVEVLQAYLGDHRRSPRTAAAAPLVFLGQTGDAMTRFGVAEVIERALQRAALVCPSLQGRQLTAHSMRHTTAVHLLHGGASLVSIQNWLGHESLDTVQTYLALNLKNKRDILERCFTLDNVTAKLADHTPLIPPQDRAEDWLQGL